MAWKSLRVWFVFSDFSVFPLLSFPLLFSLLYISLFYSFSSIPLFDPFPVRFLPLFPCLCFLTSPPFPLHFCSLSSSSSHINHFLPPLSLALLLAPSFPHRPSRSIPLPPPSFTRPLHPPSFTFSFLSSPSLYLTLSSLLLFLYIFPPNPVLFLTPYRLSS